MPRPVFALCLLLFALRFPHFTNNNTDDLDHVGFEGWVKDAAGNAVVDARVFVKHLASANERSTTTNNEGRYRFSLLLPGVYELRVEAGGFQSLKFEKINAVAGATIRHNLQLSPAAVQEQITVSAETGQPLIDTARTIVGGTVTRQQIDALPVESRNPLDLIYTLPGTAPPALTDKDLADGDRKDSFRRTPEESGIFSLTGGTAFSNNLTIEGLDNNDDRAARERFVPSLHAVEEVQVVSNQFSAEYGRASGGRVNLRLRGGSNEFHGQAFYYFRDESLNANTFRRNADPERGKRLQYQNHNPGASLGGPVKNGRLRDKLFFFVAYEHDYIYDKAEIAALLPVAANPAFPLPKPTGANLGFMAVDRTGKPIEVNDGAAVGLYDETLTTPRVAHTWQTRGDVFFNANHNAFAIFTLARNRDERGFPGGRRTLDTIRSTGRDSQSVSFGDNLILSPRLLSSARFQFSRLTPADAPPNDNPVILINIDDPRDVPGNPNANPFSRNGNLTAGSSNLGGTDRSEQRFQFQETLSYSHGAHSLRIGGDLQSIRSRFLDRSDATGTFTFASPADFLANKPSRYEHRFFTESELRNTYTGVFAQDDWKLRPSLTMSFGLRWDNETILNDRNNFGPRLSFAWSPRKSNKTVMRGGYGIFYNRAMLRTLDDFILTSTTLGIDTNTALAKPLLAQLQFPAALKSDDPRVKQLGVREAGFLRRLSKDFRIPESYQATFGFERELARGFKVEVNYVFNRGLHLWREVNANAPRLPAGFSDFARLLTSRDFDNRRDPVTGQRPLTATGNADIVRFNLSQQPTQTSREGNQSIVSFGLNNPSTSNATAGIQAAFAAIRQFRPDPSLTQIEELQARGNSQYHGVSFEVSRRLTERGVIRGSYTLSRLLDDGVVNTSSPLVAGDFRREHSLSLLDARHRAAISGYYQTPRTFGAVAVAGTLNIASAQPFNIGANGNDRNLDDINNDRPIFTGSLDGIRWRALSSPLDPALADAFALPTIGTVGNLPRNAGRGPVTHSLNLRLSRAFQLAEHRKLEFQLEAFNPFNSTVFSFGAEFVDFTPSSLSNFLVPQRTIRPRTVRVGLKFEF
ncbi:MAG TPA: TonB-dependent receptor [Blastocatellia bacterium]|nr:TonB-dependent receptor [Blastocatellia bacterium]HMV83983.1 TonB-dependent receptor [Blastocatellia bacterium]HMY74324.1 TonB-dependent receptor [Blastocatellia bacterium]HMZ18204.1 TonB-dependent receptor [Blastocatellia bacterium]